MVWGKPFFGSAHGTSAQYGFVKVHFFKHARINPRCAFFAVLPFVRSSTPRAPDVCAFCRRILVCSADMSFRRYKRRTCVRNANLPSSEAAGSLPDGSASGTPEAARVRAIACWRAPPFGRGVRERPLAEPWLQAMAKARCLLPPLSGGPLELDELAICAKRLPRDPCVQGVGPADEVTRHAPRPRLLQAEKM